MMKKSLLALILVAAMLLSGCSLVLKDQSVDNLLPILDVNGEIVNKQTFNSLYEYNVYMEEYYNSMMASMFGTSYEVDTNAILEDTIDTYINSLVTSAKAKELGFDQFTAEEEAELAAQAQADYDETVAMIKDMYFVDSELSEEEITKEAEAYAASNGASLEQTLASNHSAKISERLEASVTDLVTDVDDAKLQAYLDNLIAEEKADYESSLSVWGASKNNGTAYYYTPAGYRTVRVIETAKPVAAEGEEAAPADEVKAQMDDLHTRAAAGEKLDALSADAKTYAVCESSTDLDEAIVAAAMQLTKVGEVSPVTETEDSFILVEYVEDVAEHTATLEEAREAIYADALAAAKDEAYTAQLDQWISDANIKIYRENLSL